MVFIHICIIHKRSGIHKAIYIVDITRISIGRLVIYKKR